MDSKRGKRSWNVESLGFCPMHCTQHQWVIHSFIKWRELEEQKNFSKGLLNGSHSNTLVSKMTCQHFRMSWTQFQMEPELKILIWTSRWRGVLVENIDLDVKITWCRSWKYWLGRIDDSQLQVQIVFCNYSKHFFFILSTVSSFYQCQSISVNLFFYIGQRAGRLA